MSAWAIERIVHFGPADLVEHGCVHFGFHDQSGRHLVLEHQKHFLGLIGADDRLEWTVAAAPVFADVPNIPAALEFPMYADSLSDGSVVVSNFLSARLYRVDVQSMAARLVVDGGALGMVDMGNCMVDDQDSIWVNEVTGCRVWRFDADGAVIEVLGDGQPGFQPHAASFDQVRFNRIYDIRRGPSNRICVLDSGNFAVRVIDPAERLVVTVAGMGTPGYSGDGGDARRATFGSDPAATFDGPISLALDAAGTMFVGDRFNHVVRMIDAGTGIITTIAGQPGVDDGRPNDPRERDPLRLNLPEISSLDWFDGRLFVPTDLSGHGGDLAVLRRI